MITAPTPALLWMLAFTLAGLAAGTVVRFVGLRNAEEELRRKRFASLRTWWMITLVICGCLLAGRLGVCLLLAITTGIALHEYAALVGVRPHERRAVRAAYVVAALNYALILFDQPAAFVVFLPLVLFATLAVAQVLSGNPSDYLRFTGALFWGGMALIYGVSHAAFLFILPASSTGPTGPAGWFLFLLILTEVNDIFQAVIGRALGAHKRHRITPTISPNKTWEGFFGGMLVTIGFALLLAPWLTRLGAAGGPAALPEFLRPWLAPAAAGIVIAVAGFFGDVNMSAVKRDAGVKDSSARLPGMGGLIDRVDSLTFTAPAFVYFLLWWMN